MNRTTSYGCISFFMIRKFSLFCKLIRIKTSSESLFSSFMKDYSLAMEECPCCHSKDNCIFHSFYERNLIDFIQETTVYHKISVTRVKCQSCGHTHAILPDLIIPYGQYSLFFLLRVLAEYFAHSKTIPEICERYSITASMLYRWKLIFLRHMSDWLPVLEQLEISPYGFLKQLCTMESFSVSFALLFFRLTAFSFLQSHQNPG